MPLIDWLSASSEMCLCGVRRTRETFSSDFPDSQSLYVVILRCHWLNDWVHHQKCVYAGLDVHARLLALLFLFIHFTLSCDTEKKITFFSEKFNIFDLSWGTKRIDTPYNSLKVFCCEFSLVIRLKSDKVPRWAWLICGKSYFTLEDPMEEPPILLWKWKFKWRFVSRYPLMTDNFFSSYPGAKFSTWMPKTTDAATAGAVADAAGDDSCAPCWSRRS